MSAACPPLARSSWIASSASSIACGSVAAAEAAAAAGGVVGTAGRSTAAAMSSPFPSSSWIAWRVSRTVCRMLSTCGTGATPRLAAPALRTSSLLLAACSLLSEAALGAVSESVGACGAGSSAAWMGAAASALGETLRAARSVAPWRPLVGTLLLLLACLLSGTLSSLVTSLLASLSTCFRASALVRTLLTAPSEAPWPLAGTLLLLEFSALVTSLLASLSVALRATALTRALGGSEADSGPVSSPSRVKKESVLLSEVSFPEESALDPTWCSGGCGLGRMCCVFFAVRSGVMPRARRRHRPQRSSFI